jgi:hypothetical protein
VDVNDLTAFVREWRATKWFDESDYEIADEVLQAIKTDETDIIETIDEMLSRRPIVRYMNFLLDVRSMVSPSAEDGDEGCQVTEQELVST